MQMEAETISMLISGFIIISVISLIVVFKLFKDNKNKSYLWFIGQIFFLSLSFLKFLQLIKGNAEMPEFIKSEENSFAFGIIGVLWSISMLCMLLGIWRIGKILVNKRR